MAFDHRGRRDDVSAVALDVQAGPDAGSGFHLKVRRIEVQMPSLTRRARFPGRGQFSVLGFERRQRFFAVSLAVPVDVHDDGGAFARADADVRVGRSAHHARICSGSTLASLNPCVPGNGTRPPGVSGKTGQPRAA